MKIASAGLPQGPPDDGTGCRVLHLLQGLAVGGLERVVLQLAARSRRHGYDDRLLLYDTPAGRGAADLEAGGVPQEFLPRRPGVDWGFAVRLRDYLRARRVQVLHAHNDTALFYGALALLAGARGVRLVATLHNAPSHPTWRARLLTRWAAAQAAHVAVVSDELLARLRAGGWLKDGTVIPNGVDADEFAPLGAVDGWRERLALPRTALLVGHVGRLDENKRQADLLDAARLARRVLPQLYVVFAGQGPLLPDFERRAAGEEFVRFVPRVGDVAAFLRELDLFVLCSRHEGAPLALLEAMACARAVVATRVGGIPQIVGEGEAGAALLVPPGDPQALGEALVAIGRSPDLRRDLGARARARVLAAFSAEQTWLSYEAVYRRAVSSRDLSA